MLKLTKKLLIFCLVGINSLNASISVFAAKFKFIPELPSIPYVPVPEKPLNVAPPFAFVRPDAIPVGYYDKMNEYKLAVSRNVEITEQNKFLHLSYIYINLENVFGYFGLSAEYDSFRASIGLDCTYSSLQTLKNKLSVAEKKSDFDKDDYEIVLRMIEELEGVIRVKWQLVSGMRFMCD